MHEMSKLQGEREIHKKREIQEEREMHEMSKLQEEREIHKKREILDFGFVAM
jgi:hypothetical protein